MKNKLAELGRKLVELFHREQFDAELEEEMRLHQELREQEQVERGVSPEEARYSAQRRFGTHLEDVASPTPFPVSPDAVAVDVHSVSGARQ
jgi:hypothetical protein